MASRSLSAERKPARACAAAGAGQSPSNARVSDQRINAVPKNPKISHGFARISRINLVSYGHIHNGSATSFLCLPSTDTRHFVPPPILLSDHSRQSPAPVNSRQWLLPTNLDSALGPPNAASGWFATWSPRRARIWSANTAIFGWKVKSQIFARTIPGICISR